MNTKEIGELSELKIITRLKELGKTILQPYGDNQRYDIVIEEKNEFKKIQIKTGKLKNGIITFPTCSSYAHRRKGEKKDYIGDIDYFGIYCPGNKKCYLFPISNQKRAVQLRIENTKNNQKKDINWAKDYEL